MVEYVYELEVTGMRCGMCESHINDVIRNNFDIKVVKSNRHKNLVIIISRSPLDTSLIKEVISKEGYTCSDINSYKRSKNGFLARKKEELK